MNLKEASTYFDGVTRFKDNSFQCKCPVHHDHAASMTVSKGKKGILIHCHAGCETKSILEAVGLRESDLFYDSNVTKVKQDWKDRLEHSKRKKIVEIYNYVDQNGKYLYSKIRFKKDENGKKEMLYGVLNKEKDWFQYPVFHIDFNGDNFAKEGVLEAAIEGYLGNWEDMYGKNPNYTTPGTRFIELLRRASEKTGRRAVVLVDEYDKPILDVLDTPLEEENRNTLKAFYSTFKGADKYLQFVMLTGVTKFSQVSVFSGFNQPKDISMDPRYESLCGITQEEMERYFHEPISELAEKDECTYEEMKERLKAQYDGYHFSENMLDIYNPFSILNAFDSLQIRDYWFASGTPTYLVRLLQHSNEQINELVGQYYDASLFADYKADVERPLPMIYQSGYLTICLLYTSDAADE
mgnify:CR=1 FL=1